MNDKQKRALENLKKHALNKGFDKFVFRNNRINKNMGDFTIFLYDYKKNPLRYVIGFDGVWETGWKISFDSIIEQVYEYIDSYENSCVENK